MDIGFINALAKFFEAGAISDEQEVSLIIFKQLFLIVRTKFEEQFCCN